MILLVVIFQSCNQGESLQRYYVDHQEQPHFLSMDVPLSMLNLDKEQLTDEQLDAYKSVRKLNMLAYKHTPENTMEYEEEVAKVKTILNNSRYEELMRGGNPEEGSFIIKVLGKGDDIEEFILFGNMDNKGFAIVRVLGKDMNPDKIMSLTSALDKTNISSASISQFTEVFK